MLGNKQLQWVLCAVAFTMYLTGSPAQTGSKKIPKPVVRQVDHISIQTNDPQALFDFFTSTLEFPVAWPLNHYAEFSSAGIGAGSMNLEVFEYASARKPANKSAAHARFVGIAFQPYPLDECLVGLKEREILYGEPEAYISTLPGGSEGTLWTRVMLPQFSGPGLSVFLYEYSTAFLDVYVRRKQVLGQLALNGGGPLGFQCVKEVVVGTTDVVQARREWQKLLVPKAQSSQNVWPVGDGPAIRLASDSQDRLREIVFEVRSLDKARSFLRQNKLLGSSSRTALWIDHRKIQGLRIRLTEHPPEVPK